MPDLDRTTVIFSGGGTGGHLYPALALADALTRMRPRLRSVFIGAERGIEARVFPLRGVEHLLVPVEGLRRDSILANVRVLRALSGALASVGRLMRSLRPALVVVTGGYAGGPAGIMAGLLRIRLVLQEQNAEPGVTTRLLSLWADEIYLAFPEARDRLPGPARSRARTTGNPVRPPQAIDRGEAAARFGLDPERPVVLAVGGSQGAAVLNDAIVEIVSSVATDALPPLPDTQILWATGPGHIGRVEEALAAAGRPDWVRPIGYIEEMPAALSLADLAVSRAGAMATSEFLAWGIPSILVPLPTAAADHQTRNARALESGDAARCLPQAELTAALLHATIAELMGDPALRARMSRAARERGRPRAAAELAVRLDALLPPEPMRRAS